MKKAKNTYEATDVNVGGGKEYGSDLHGITVKINQYVWDMMKVLERHELFGFHFSAKIGTTKTIVVLSHEDQEILEQGRRLLKDISARDQVIFLTKVKEKKSSKKIFVVLGLIAILAIFLKVGLSFYENYKINLEIEERQNSRETASKDGDIITQKIEIDIEKLKVMQEVFKKSKSKEMEMVTKMMGVTTAVISDMVPESEKAKYSSEELVKNFKGKGGFEFVLKDSNQSQDFDATAEELNAYAMEFVKENNFESAMACYQKALKKRDISREDKVTTLSNQATLYDKIGEHTKAQENHKRALSLERMLSDQNFEKHAAKMAWSLSKMAEWESNQTKEIPKELEEAKAIYLKLVEKYRKLSETNPQKYQVDLAWSLNLLANFYENDLGLTIPSLKPREEALLLYQKLLDRDKKERVLSYYKTLNSLANSYKKINQKRRSQELYTKGLTLMQELSQKDSKTYQYYFTLSLLSMAEIEGEMKRFEKAEIYYTKALEAYELLKIKESKHSIPLHLLVRASRAKYDANRGAFDRAKKEYSYLVESYKALNKLHSHQYNINIANALNGLAMVAIMDKKDQNPKEANSLITTALKYAEAVKKRDYFDYKEVAAKSYVYRGYLYTITGRVDRALKAYEKALKLHSSIESRTSYIALLLQQKRYIDANKAYKLMLHNHKSKAEQAKILKNYGYFFLDISPEGAKERLEKALLLYSELKKIGGDYDQEIEHLLVLLKKKSVVSSSPIEKR